MKQRFFGSIAAILFGCSSLLFSATAAANAQFHNFRINSATAATITYGDNATFYIQAEGTTVWFVARPPNGNMYFGYGARLANEIPATVICATGLTGMGGDMMQATCTARPGAAGTFSVWATRKTTTGWFSDWWTTESGRNYSGSPATITLTVDKAQPTISVSGPAQTALNETFTLTGTLGGGNYFLSGASGTISFYAAGIGTPLCTATLPATNCTVVGGLSSGTYSITAEYSGDGNFKPATSTPISLISQTAGIIPAISLAANPAGSAALGDTVTYTTTLTGLISGAASGTVNILGPSGVLCSTTTITPTVPTATATCTSDSLAPGSHNIVAEYSGGGNYDYSTGALVGYQVTKRTPVLTLSHSPSPAIEGFDVVLTATLSNVLSSFPISSATVAFAVDGTVVCTAVSINNDTAECTVPASSLSPGASQTVTATVAESTNYTAATGSGTLLSVFRTVASFTPASALDGATNIPFVARITAPSTTAVPPGSVTIDISDATGTPVASCANIILSATGEADCLIPGPLAQGTYDVSITYTAPAGGIFDHATASGQFIVTLQSNLNAIPTTSTGVLMLMGLVLAMLGFAGVRRRQS